MQGAFRKSTSIICNKYVLLRTGSECVILFIHCVSKKVPTFILSVTLSNLNRLSHFLHCWKAYEICYKTYTKLPTSLRCVATLPWEINNSNFWPPVNSACVSRRF